MGVKHVGASPCTVALRTTPRGMAADTKGAAVRYVGAVVNAVEITLVTVRKRSGTKGIQTDRAILALYGRTTPKAMSTVVGGMKGLRAVDLVSMARGVEERMTGNPNFPDAGPLVAMVTAAREALMAAIVDAMDGGHTAHFIQRERKAELQNALTKLLNHVLSVGLGDMTKLVSSGFPQRKPAVRIGALAAPQNLVARHGDHPGQVHVAWDPVHGARLYRLEMNDGDPDHAEGWRKVAEMSHAHYTLDGLASLHYYWFRVIVIGTAGDSPYSDPARSVAI